jgi:hypothetical protein
MGALNNHLWLKHFAPPYFYLGKLIPIEFCLFFPFYPKIQGACASK